MRERQYFQREDGTPLHYTLVNNKDWCKNDFEVIVETYQYRPDHIEKYSRRVAMDEIEKNGYNLNISRYVSISEDEVQIDLADINVKLTSINNSIKDNTEKHNDFLKELGLNPI